MLELEVFYKKIRKQLKEKLPFVVYSKPDELHINTILQKDDSIYTSKDFSESGFILAPFCQKNQSILIPNHLTYKISKGNKKAEDITLKIDYVFDEKDKAQHIALIEKAIKSIRNNELKKVVLSRVEKLAYSQIDIINIFEILAFTYPSAFSYLWYHPKIGIWLGATPETLLKVSGNKFSTMALAGTQLYQNKLDVEWREKEKFEQRIVTDTILSALGAVNTINNITFSKVKTIRAGDLLHLKTDIEGILETTSLKQVIQALHPTPAVCGFPKEKASSFILDNENYKRTFYTGFLGELNMKSEIDKKENFSNLYVNLRCMEVNDNFISIFTGGGITSDSIPDAEWVEVLNKTRTMKKVIVTSKSY